MPIFIVGTERNISELNERVLRPATERAEVTRITERLREANPQVDFDRLEPGTVIAVPRDEIEVFRPEAVITDRPRPAGGTRPPPRGNDPISGGVEAVFGALAQILAEVEGTTYQQAEKERGERGDLVDLLGSAQVAAAIRNDPDAAALVEQTLVTMRDEDAEHERKLGLAGEALAGWSQALADLRSKVPGI